MSETVRVFVNGRGLDVPAGGTALDAVSVYSASDARLVVGGELLVTDSRGLPVPTNTALFNGALFRIVPNRARDASDPAAQFDA